MSVAALSAHPGWRSANPQSWVDVSRRAPALAATISAYLEVLAGRLEPRSVEAAEVACASSPYM
jgi:hypothetical protein